MSEELEIFKKKLLYRASYRGSKEMDILLSSFVKKYIHDFSYDQLKDLENFLKLEDETILEYYNIKKSNKSIDNNSISKIFRDFKM